MRNSGIKVKERDLAGQPLDVAELEAVIGKRDHLQFLNPRNELYKERNMKEHPPSRSEALKLMSENPNLIRRPIVVSGSKVLVGFDEASWKKEL